MVRQWVFFGTQNELAVALSLVPTCCTLLRDFPIRLGHCNWLCLHNSRYKHILLSLPTFTLRVFHHQYHQVTTPQLRTYRSVYLIIALSASFCFFFVSLVYFLLTPISPVTFDPRSCPVCSAIASAKAVGAQRAFLAPRTRTKSLPSTVPRATIATVAAIPHRKVVVMTVARRLALGRDFAAAGPRFSHCLV